jgi:enterochelin esterase-like enzyme
MRTAAFLLGLVIPLSVFAAAPAESYPVPPDAVRQEGVPVGKVTKHEWTSKVFEGTVRDYWVYVPAQYDGQTPAAVMVFQDGSGYVNEKGDYKTTIVFDNLIHKKEMPVTIGIFINPGSFPSNAAGAARPRSNRSFEYDTLSDQYARFLLEEMLPEVGKSYKLTDDPEMRAIGGLSSGAICAFTVAWERPDAFRKVLSNIGSFTSIAYRPARDGQPMRPGGDLYPALIRKTPKKPIRVFLQDGRNDLDNNHGNWFIANQDMEAALKFAKYEVKAVWGEGSHSGKHGGAILPDSLRWLWRKE